MSAPFISPQAQIDAVKAAIGAFDSGKAPGVSHGAFIADRLGLVRDRIARSNNPDFARTNAAQLAALDDAITALRRGAMLPARDTCRRIATTLRIVLDRAERNKAKYEARYNEARGAHQRRGDIASVMAEDRGR